MKALAPIKWRGQSDGVYLTFDDGPDENFTPRILDLLARLAAKASFFVVGEKATQSPQLVARIFAEGHTVGNHSFSHQRMVVRRSAFLLDEITRTDEILTGITGEKPTLFRPPYGQFGPGLLRALKKTKHEMVLWNDSVQDFKASTTAKTISSRFRKICGPGKILLLHDGHSNSDKTVAALQSSLPQLVELGFSFKKLGW